MLNSNQNHRSIYPQMQKIERSLFGERSLSISILIKINAMGENNTEDI